MQRSRQSSFKKKMANTIGYQVTFFEFALEDTRHAEGFFSTIIYYGNVKFHVLNIGFLKTTPVHIALNFVILLFDVAEHKHKTICKEWPATEFLTSIIGLSDILC